MYGNATMRSHVTGPGTLPLAPRISDHLAVLVLQNQPLAVHGPYSLQEGLYFVPTLVAGVVLFESELEASHPRLGGLLADAGDLPVSGVSDVEAHGAERQGQRRHEADYQPDLET